MIEIEKIVICGLGAEKKVFIEYRLDDESQPVKIYTWAEFQDLKIDTDIKNAANLYLSE